MKKQIAALSLSLTLTACGSASKKSEAPPTAAPSGPAVGLLAPGAVDLPKADASVDAGGIPSSTKTLTPVQVPGNEPSDPNSGPSIALKPDPLSSKPAKIGANGKSSSDSAKTPVLKNIRVGETAPEAETPASATTAPVSKVAVAKTPSPGVDPDTSLRWLKNGNTRFAKGWLRKDGATMKDIKRVVTQHRPHAIVLASSDGRVPPELVFDQKLGELFTIRTLGPSLSKEVLGSMEYAVLNLGTRHIVVLGHSSCGGAKIAYITLENQNIKGSENLDAVVHDIQPRIKPVLEGGKQPSKNFIEECWANTQGVAREIADRSPVIKEAMNEGQLKISSALYDLETGKVEFR